VCVCVRERERKREREKERERVCERERERGRGKRDKGACVNFAGERAAHEPHEAFDMVPKYECLSVRTRSMVGSGFGCAHVESDSMPKLLSFAFTLPHARTHARTHARRCCADAAHPPRRCRVRRDHNRFTNRPTDHTNQCQGHVVQPPGSSEFGVAASSCFCFYTRMD
jgi:hypothetical protein